MKTTKLNDATATNSAKPRDGFVTITRNVLDAVAAKNEALHKALLFIAANGKIEKCELIAGGVSEKSVATYTSEWNQAATLAGIIGADRVGKLLADKSALAATGEVRTYRAMLAVIRAAIAQGKAQGVKGQATKSQAAAIVKATPQAVATRHANAQDKATKSRGARGPNVADVSSKVIADAAKHAPAAIAHGIRLLSNTAHGMAAPEGREAAWQLALKALSDAVLALDAFK